MSKLTECPECHGEGQLFDIKAGPNGPIEYYEECSECSGEGEVEIEEGES